MCVLKSNYHQITSKIRRIFDAEFGKCFKMNALNNFFLGRNVQKQSVFAGSSSNISNKRPAEVKIETESEPKRKKYAKEFVRNFKDEVFDVCLLYAECAVLFKISI